MTTTARIHAFLTFILAIGATIALRLGMWPDSLPPFVLAAGVVVVLLLGGGVALLSGSGGTGGNTRSAIRGARPAGRSSATEPRVSPNVRALHGLARRDVPVCEMARQTGLPQDLVRSFLGQRSTRQTGRRV